jgi:hypothetical protein
MPTIEPVRRYVVIDDEILLFVSSGSRISEAMHFNVVSFEVDNLDDEGFGQHVVVVGQTAPAARGLLELVCGTAIDKDESIFVLRCELVKGQATTRTAAAQSKQNERVAVVSERQR